MFDREKHNKAIAQYDQGIAWADYILENTTEPTGMVETWRKECIKRHATYRMLELLGEEYVRVALECVE
jgi:hypothetical protein|tara:strand:- start:758 stop:964 length:207 start_codon:yes stop_codon:yes gene_type:complete